MKLNLVGLPEELRDGLRQIKNVLDIEICDDGIPVNVIKGDCISVTFKNGRGEITFARKHQFFRALGLFEKSFNEDSFNVKERQSIDDICTMIDVSRNAVFKVATIKELIDYIALMGYTQFMLYTEDTYKVPEQPYMGYLRGRYSSDELKNLDDYAYAYGIEMISHIQALGHLEHFLKWYYELWNNSCTILAGEPRTYEIIEQMIRAATKPYRSNKIHIGMDEARYFATGKYLEKNGYVPVEKVFCEHLSKVVDICDKYNLKPMMSTDMFGKILKQLKCADNDIPLVFANIIPENIQLANWNHSDEAESIENTLSFNFKFNRDVIFATSTVCEFGYFSNAARALRNAKASVSVCKRMNVKGLINTCWLDGGADCNIYTSLAGLCAAAEYIYTDEPSDDDIKESFEFITGMNLDLILTLGDFHRRAHPLDGPQGSAGIILGRNLLWQDIMCGVMDRSLFAEPMSGHYRQCREGIEILWEKGSKWDWLYNYAVCVFDVMETKSYIAENLQPAYKNNDKKFLAECAEFLLPSLGEKISRMHRLHGEIWQRECKIFGYEVLEIRYFTLEGRAKTARERISAYLNGDLDKLEELEEDRLHFATENGNTKTNQDQFEGIFSACGYAPSVY